MKAILSAAVALLIGVAALTLAHPGEQKSPNTAPRASVETPAPTVAVR